MSLDAVERELTKLKEKVGTHDMRLGCEMAAHKYLGFCGYCPGVAFMDELMGWRLLALKNQEEAKRA